ncbi:MAG: glycerophosphodiester phosphodiesterase family protein [Calditrichaeota bacterium]|nr:glycerophosphodiester phosphodiesterase family protein [Calditrichota bacterium]
MRKRWFPLLVFLLAAALLLLPVYLISDTRYYLAFQSVKELQEFISWSPKKSPLIGAHRGGPMPGFPENAIRTFENALKYAPCLIELDVRKTRDGIFVLMHDSTLDRTTTGKGPVSRYTWKELQQLYLRDNQGRVTEDRIPSLAEVFQWARGRAILELDIKRPIQPEEIVAFIREHRAEAFSIVITYSWKTAVVYHQLHPELVISAPAYGVKGTQRLLQSGIPYRNLIAFVGVREPDPKVYQLLHQHGIRAILGTMGNLDRKARRRGVRVYIQLLENGADVLSTDNVPLAARAIQEFVKMKQLLPVIDE